MSVEWLVVVIIIIMEVDLTSHIIISRSPYVFITVNINEMAMTTQTIIDEVYSKVHTRGKHNTSQRFN